MEKMSVLTLTMPADKVPAVVDHYRRTRILEESGAAAGSVLIDDENPGTVLVTALWSDADGYADWLDSPLRTRFGAGLLAAAGGELRATGREFRVAHRS